MSMWRVWANFLKFNPSPQASHGSIEKFLQYFEVSPYQHQKHPLIQLKHFT